MATKDTILVMQLSAAITDIIIDVVVDCCNVCIRILDQKSEPTRNIVEHLGGSVYAVLAYYEGTMAMN